MSLLIKHFTGHYYPFSCPTYVTMSSAHAYSEHWKLGDNAWLHASADGP